MHIKSQINKTTIYFCSRCYGYLTMDVKFKNRKKKKKTSEGFEAKTTSSAVYFLSSL